MRLDRRIVLVFSVVLANAIACSVFVSLDDLQSDVASDASSLDDVATKDASPDTSSDAISVTKDANADGPPASSIVFVQTKGDYYSSAGLNLLAPVTEGNALIVVVDNPSPGAVTATDNQSDVYTTVFGPFPASTGANISVLACFHMKGGAQNIKVGLSDGGTGYIYYAAEYSGLSAFDKASTGSSASTATDGLTSGSVVTTATPELIFAYALALGNLHPGSGFNARSIFDGNTIEDRIVSLPGTYQATATIIGGQGDIVLACFH